MNHSKSALAFVAAERAKRPSDSATWMDVASAYDQGIRHALQSSPASRRAVRRQYGPKCAVCGFAEQMSIHEPRLHGHPLPFGRGHYHQFQREAERAEGGQS